MPEERKPQTEAPPRVETEDEKAKRLAEQAEGPPKDELADRTGRRR